jgi:glycosyltransferase involved in cell wall biosynthesis
MADKSGLILHFITDPLLGIETANSVARIEMAKAFCRQSQVKKLYFHNMAESKKKLESLHLSDVSEKLVLKPLFFKEYKEKTLQGKSFWAFCYKLFFASPIISLRAFFIALTVRKTDGVYIRGLESLFGFYFGSLITNAKYIFELHNYTFGTNKIADFFYRRIMKRAAFIVTVSEYTKCNWVENGIAEAKIIVLPSGVSMEDFDSIDKGKEQLRKELGFAKDKKIITYTGGLYDNRGIEDLLYCASQYKDYLFLFLGGVEKHIEKYKLYIQQQFQEQLQNAVFRGYVKHDTIASYLKASDILVAPYSKKVETAHHMSSVKLIEYMASKVPVITVDLPRIRDVACEDEVTFFQPDDADDLCAKIKHVFDNYQQTKTKALKAYEKVKNFTWDKRAEKIVNLFQS